MNAAIGHLEPLAILHAGQKLGKMPKQVGGQK